MKPVFGLVEDERLRSVDHGVGDFLAAVGREAMEHDGVFRGGVE